MKNASTVHLVMFFLCLSTCTLLVQADTEDNRQSRIFPGLTESIQGDYEVTVATVSSTGRTYVVFKISVKKIETEDSNVLAFSLELSELPELRRVAQRNGKEEILHEWECHGLVVHYYINTLDNTSHSRVVDDSENDDPSPCRTFILRFIATLEQCYVAISPSKLELGPQTPPLPYESATLQVSLDRIEDENFHFSIYSRPLVTSHDGKVMKIGDDLKKIGNYIIDANGILLHLETSTSLSPEDGRRENKIKYLSKDNEMP